MSLRPVHTSHREHLALDGLWEWKPQPDDAWAPIAVPASWNDQFAGGRDHLGPVRYRTAFRVPKGWAGEALSLRFDSVVHQCTVRLNGEEVGGHVGGHLPFTIELSGPDGAVEPTGSNELEVIVDGNLSRDTVPPGGDMSWSVPTHPPVSFDFFPYSGINRPVRLVMSPTGGITSVEVESHADGRLRVRAAHGRDNAVLRVSVAGSTTTGGHDVAEMLVADVRRWSMADPHLEGLMVELVEGDAVVDCYVLDVGFRTVRVDDTQILLNDEPVWLRGFGRHEDVAINGRGLNLAVCVKDMDILRWCGGNSFRTTHYPYAEETLDLADRLGVLVISESPAVGLNWGDGDDHEANRLAACRQATEEMIARDRNHPSVIMWSLANEPHSAHQAAKSEPFFAELYQLARSLDDTRPVTHVAEPGRLDPSFDHADVICLNRYQGWYSHNGQLADGLEDLRSEIERVHAAYPERPVMLTEFGADTVAGHHDLESAMWSEEFQADMLDGFIDVCESLPYVVGAHVWNLCDFATAQNFFRATGLNLKGIFTRDRRPKLAAHRLRARWYS